MSVDGSPVTSGDFTEVINAVAQLGLFIVAGLGVWVAYSQLEASRTERHNQRRAELAEEMIVIVHQVLDAFKHIRNPFDSIPQDKIQDKEFVYRKRYERITESNELFRKLREFQVRVDALAGFPATESFVTKLFNARADVAMAIEELIDFAGKDLGDRYRDEKTIARKNLYGTWSERDKLGQEIQAAVRGIISAVSQYAARNGRFK